MGKSFDTDADEFEGLEFKRDGPCWKLQQRPTPRYLMWVPPVVANQKPEGSKHTFWEHEYLDLMVLRRAEDSALRVEKIWMNECVKVPPAVHQWLMKMRAGWHAAADLKDLALDLQDYTSWAAAGGRKSPLEMRLDETDRRIQAAEAKLKELDNLSKQLAADYPNRVERDFEEIKATINAAKRALKDAEKDARERLQKYRAANN